MESREEKKKLLKKHLNGLLSEEGFKRLGSGWYTEQGEHVVVLHVQASSYSSLYYLNVKLFIQGMWGKSYPPEKKLVTLGGNISGRPLGEYAEGLNLENDLTNDERCRSLERMVREYLHPLKEKLLTPEGVFQLYEEKPIGFFMFDNVIDEFKRVLAGRQSQS